MWTPKFACPECGADLGPRAEACWCTRCGRQFEYRDGMWRFLTPARVAALEPFLAQYRVVRAGDGHRQALPEYYCTLPSVGEDHPQAGEWRVRRETYHHLLRHVLAEAQQSRRFQFEYGLATIVPAGAGYLTFPSLETAARTLQMQPAYVPSRGPLAWRMKRRLSRLRLGRAPAAFGLWIAR